MKVDWMTRYDVSEVLDTDNELTEQDIYSRMSKRDMIGVVVKEGGKITGYAMYQLLPDCYNIVAIGGRNEAIVSILKHMKAKTDRKSRVCILKEDYALLRQVAALGYSTKLVAEGVKCGHIIP